MLKEKVFSHYQQAADYLLAKLPQPVEIAVVLGTGLGGLLDQLEDKIEIPYADIPNFLLSTVASHPGKFIYGKLGQKTILCMSGRFHYYEGYDYNELVTPVYVMKLLGIKTLILTNAAGAINFNFHPGDICLITDHLNFASVAPTRGKNLDEFGPRFFPLADVYDKELRKLAHDCANKLGQTLKEGIYFFTVGPHFETPAEIRAMRTLGADLVGMSTISESITAAHCGIKVLAFSLATNYSTDRVEKMDGSEVEEVAAQASDRLLALVNRIVNQL